MPIDIYNKTLKELIAYDYLQVEYEKLKIEFADLKNEYILTKKLLELKELQIIAQQGQIEKMDNDIMKLENAYQNAIKTSHKETLRANGYKRKLEQTKHIKAIKSLHFLAVDATLGFIIIVLITIIAAQNL